MEGILIHSCKGYVRAKTIGDFTFILIKNAQNQKPRPVYYCSFKSFRIESGLRFGICALFLPKNAKANIGNPAISDIFQLKISDKFHETDISMENLPIAIQDTFRHNFSD